MSSIFEPAKDSEFWNSCEIDPRFSLPIPLYTGTLITYSKNISKSVHYELYHHQLLKTNQTTTKLKVCFLSFRSFKPFEDSSSSGKRFGFSIDEKDFYVSSQKELDEWISHLSPICILEDIDSDYIKIKKIGSGGTSSVYLSKSLVSSKEYAIKSIEKSEILNNPIITLNIVSEISILQDIKHKNIVKLLYVYESETTVDLVFEYIKGGTLYNRLNTLGRVKEETAKLFMRDLLETINFLHTQEVTHRDLKLENIVFCDDDSLDFKIIDFGIGFEGKTDDIVCGSAGYMAPEILKENEYGNKIDVYSAGVILFALLCGSHPFTGKNSKQVKKKNREGKFKIDKSVSEQAQKVIKAMMEPNPDLRKTAKQVLGMSWFYESKDVSLTTITTNIALVCEGSLSSCL